MKKLIIFGIIATISSSIQSCPTCVSSAHDYTPPFFSEDFYLPYEKNETDKRSKIIEAVDNVKEESHEDNQTRESDSVDSPHNK
jgi:hypothetical protein